MRALAPLLLLALVLPGCASPESGAGEPVVFPDVHGVAIDPDEPAFVYVATHRGLFRGNADGWARVGETTNDLMGFSLAPDERAYASGHPPTGGNLGVLVTTDEGVTWTLVGAPGADMHAMAVSPVDAQRVYGWLRGLVVRSDDGGATWTNVTSEPRPLRALAAHPTQRDVVYAATGEALDRSDDAGATWTQVAAMPAFGLAVGTDALVVGGPGFLRRSTDAGTTWTDLPAPETDAWAHLALRSETIVAANYRGLVVRSDDAGATWTTIHT